MAKVKYKVKYKDITPEIRSQTNELIMPKIPKMPNEIYLKSLKKALDYAEIPFVYYSLNGFCEDAVCIEYSHRYDYWIVYNGERGNKYNIKKYKKILNACNNLILRLSENEEERIRIMKFFQNDLQQCKELQYVKKNIVDKYIEAYLKKKI